MPQKKERKKKIEKPWKREMNTNSDRSNEFLNEPLVFPFNEKYQAFYSDISFRPFIILRI